MVRVHLKKALVPKRPAASNIRSGKAVFASDPLGYRLTATPIASRSVDYGINPSLLGKKFAGISRFSKS